MALIYIKKIFTYQNTKTRSISIHKTTTLCRALLGVVDENKHRGTKIKAKQIVQNQTYYT